MPNQLWVVDFTYVATWTGVVYVAFIIDVFARRIVGWRLSLSMKAELVHASGHWKCIYPVEYATLKWVEWLNHRQLLGPIGDVPPAEFEHAYNDQLDESARAA